MGSVALVACGDATQSGPGPDPAPPPPSSGGDAGSGGGTDATTGTGHDAAPPVPQVGLRGEYFDDFTTSALVRNDAQIDFTWTAPPGAGLRAESFSVRWTGTVTPRFDETYTFTTTSDDGVRLWIDGKLVIDDWFTQGSTDTSGTIALTANAPHAVRLEYYQYLGYATVKLAWASKSQPKEIIPSSRLAPAAAALRDDAGAALPAPRPNYANPVVPFDCPDPGVMKVDGAPPTYYMACTGGSFPIRTSTDLVTWNDSGAALLPSGKAPWAGDGFRNWAPELHKAKTQYVAYYTASDGAGLLSIGAMHAPSPLGPWTDRGAPIAQGGGLGVIDAHFFADDDGRQYLYWKIDGNAVGQPTPILVQELTADGVDFAPGSSPREVLRNDSSTWEGGVVEAPWVIRRGGTYFLFYSANVYDERYATGVARATSPLGPFTKKGPAILFNSAAWVGPGHGSVVVAHGSDFFFHHAWPTVPGGGKNDAAGRLDLVDRIEYVNGWPTFAGNVSGSGALVWP